MCCWKCWDVGTFDGSAGNAFCLMSKGNKFDCNFTKADIKYAELLKKIYYVLYIDN